VTNNSQYDELILEAALIGLEQKKQEVQSRIDSIRVSLGSSHKSVAPKQASAEKPVPVQASSTSGTQKKRRTMSPEARERIAAAQRKRWAASKKAAKKAA
jgi:hypothetical protein